MLKIHKKNPYVVISSHNVIFHYNFTNGCHNHVNLTGLTVIILTFQVKKKFIYAVYIQAWEPHMLYFVCLSFIDPVYGYHTMGRVEG